MKRLLSCCTVLGLLYLNPTALNAQESGTLRGYVRDVQQEGIPFASVTLIDSCGQSVTGAYTNDMGMYVISRITPGPYAVKVMSLGYEEEIKEVMITAEKPSDRFFELRVKPYQPEPVYIDVEKNSKQIRRGQDG